MPPITEETPLPHMPEQNPEQYPHPDTNKELPPQPELDRQQSAEQPSYSPPQQPTPSVLKTPTVPTAVSNAQSLNDVGISVEQNRREALVHTALHRGLLEAVDEAKKYNDPYLLDKFHDDLVDRLKSELIKAKKLTEE